MMSMYLSMTSVCISLDTCFLSVSACICAFVMCHVWFFCLHVHACIMLVSGASVALDWLTWYSRCDRVILHG
mgnify:FL=1